MGAYTLVAFFITFTADAPKLPKAYVGCVVARLWTSDVPATDSASYFDPGVFSVLV